ncbi:MAG: iron ABC transporter substrate-binding protein [Myxococcota bacterium]|nr:iron ABC transporter substrate-binding protein [Myxococcota bacterium]
MLSLCTAIVRPALHDPLPYIIVAVLSGIGFGCQGKSPSTPVDTRQKAGTPAVAAPGLATDTQTLVVYSGRSAGLMEPLFKMFEKKTGIKVKARFDKSTQTLANRIASEGSKTEADVLLAQDSGYLGALSKAGLLAPLPATLIAKVPSAFRDEAGQWTGISGRARVLVYSPERVKPDELPASLADLTDPKWKGRLGWAPSNASFQAHISALRTLWGDEKTRAWLKGVVANEPVVYPKNSPQVRAVSKGEIDIGWVNHYYLHKLKAADPSLKAANHSFTANGDAGNLMMVSGIGIVKASQRRSTAEQLVSFLLSAEAQTYLAQKVFEYPVLNSIDRHPGVPPIQGKLAQVNQEALTDVANTVQILREFGLQ